MTAVELAACRVPEDPMSPILAGGGVRHGMRGVLRAGIWCSSTPISSLFAAVL
jgi:hypothetical protein